MSRKYSFVLISGSGSSLSDGRSGRLTRELVPNVFGAGRPLGTNVSGEVGELSLDIYLLPRTEVLNISTRHAQPPQIIRIRRHRLGPVDVGEVPLHSLLQTTS